MLTPQWIEIARSVIVEMIGVEHAVTAREIEARAAIRPWPTADTTIDPDLLTTARQQLVAERVLVAETESTRGGRPIQTFSFQRKSGISTKAERAAARKRLLTARHHSWTNPTRRYPKGLAGQAGEDTLLGLLGDLDPYSHIEPDAETAFGESINGGSIDAVGFLTTQGGGAVPQVSTMLAEIKNQRQWFYANNPDLHRFLYKAADLQKRRPEADIIPVFVSAWRQSTTYRLARILGFYAVTYRVQYILPRSEVDPDRFREVTTELGYADLRLDTKPNRALTLAFEQSIVRDARSTTNRWKAVSPNIVDLHLQIRDGVDLSTAATMLQEMERIALEIAGPPDDYVPIPTSRNR